ncbi:CehA/McbA family metallohydrolase [Actinotalea subterranea]|uniref:CehA/McbA family metallohydrolase n=1 Tax=Actinotalea subterranea TaxID=2607497 RepID=UPI0011EE5FF5|nr:CehA/McbA family metallohydrolase [Actinotalea subterranea]
MSTVEVRRRLGIDDQIAERYLRVPFEVPAGAPSVEVLLGYDRTAGVLDLGCEGASGWRGWSGGARDRFVITRDGATPGYLPGELEPGEWHVVLGLHQLPAEGLDVRLEIRTPATGAVEPEVQAAPVPDVPRGSGRDLPAPPGMTWFAGDFHAHTVHSDGSESVSEIAARAVRSGLDFVAVTDHNTTSHHAHLPAAGATHGVTLVPGQEVTTAWGHANAFGDVGWVDFRRPAATWLEQVDARGGVLSINHPVDADCAWLHPVTAPPHAMELWHATWFREPASTFAWAYWRRMPPGVVPIGGSDFHDRGQGHTLGVPTTWVAAPDRSPEAIIDAVRSGRTAISIGAALPGGPVAGPVLLRHEDDLLAFDADGAVLVDLDGRRRRVVGDRVRVPASWGHGTVHLEDAGRRLLALC